MERRQLFGGALAAVLAPRKARRRHVALWPEYTDLAQLLAGTNFVINAKGQFFYSGPPTTGNLVASLTNSSGNDGLTGGGNAYLSGQTSYLQTGPNQWVALQNNGGQLVFLTAASASGPWTQEYVLQSDASGNVVFQANGTMELNPSGVASVTGPTVIGDTPNSRATAAQLEVHSLVGLKARAQPAAPPAGYGLLYVNSADDGLYFKGSGGTNTKLAGA